MGRMSDLDIALSGIPLRLRAWSDPSILVHVSGTEGAELPWLFKVGRLLTAELWVMPPPCLMHEVST